MLKKILLLAAFAITPLVLSQDASAQCYGGGYGYGYGGYGVYRVPVYTHRVPHYHHHHHSHVRSAYRYGARYGSPYRYGGFGGIGYPYYRGGTAISVGRGGFGLTIGF